MVWVRVTVSQGMPLSDSGMLPDRQFNRQHKCILWWQPSWKTPGLSVRESRATLHRVWATDIILILQRRAIINMRFYSLATYSKFNNLVHRGNNERSVN